jgi:hypothetical protein
MKLLDLEMNLFQQKTCALELVKENVSKINVEEEIAKFSKNYVFLFFSHLLDQR